MTVETNSVVSGPFIGNGTTTIFPRTFSIGESSHVEVTFGGEIQTSGYTVLHPSLPSGNIVFNVAPENGVEIYFTRSTPIKQDTDYSSQGSVSPIQVEDDLDYRTRVEQELKRDTGLSLKYPIGTSGDVSREMPIPIEGQSLIGAVIDGKLAFSANGPNADQISNAQTYAEIAANAASNYLMVGLAFLDRGAAQTAAIAAPVQSINVLSYNHLRAPNVGGSFYKRVSESVASTYPSQAQFTSNAGTVFWVVDDKEPTPFTFDAWGSGVFDKDGGRSAVDRNGHDDGPSVRALIEYCKIEKVEGHITDYHYCVDQIEINSGVIIRGIGREKCGLRVRIQPPFNSVWLWGVGSSLLDVEVQGHCDQDVVSGGGTGGQGLCVKIGHLVEYVDHPRTADVHLRALLTRTGSISGDFSAIRGSWAALGNTNGGSVDVTFIEMATKHAMAGLLHWGGKFDAGEDLFYRPLVSWHPNNLTINLNNVVSCVNGLAMSSSFNMDVKPYETKGCGYSYLHLAGDYGERYAAPEHRRKVLKGNRIGYINATDVVGDSNINEVVLVTSRATAKDLYYQRPEHATATSPVFVRRTKDEPIIANRPNASDVAFRDQVDVDLVMEGVSARLNNGTLIGATVRAFGVSGHCDFGSISSRDAAVVAYESEFSRGTVAAVIDSDAPIRLETGQGTVSRTETQLSTLSSGSAVKVSGISETYTLKTAAAVGHSRLILNETLSYPVHKGDSIRVANHTLSATNCYNTGVNYIGTNRITEVLPAGSTVTVTRSADFDVYLESAGGREGLNVILGNVNVTGPGCRDTGENGIRARNNSVINIQGKGSKSNGRLSAASAVLAAINVEERGVVNHYGCDWGGEDVQNEFIYRVVSTGTGSAATRGRLNVFGGRGPVSGLLTSSSVFNYDFFGYVTSDGIPYDPKDP